jgi:hypothetical protein
LQPLGGRLSSVFLVSCFLPPPLPVVIRLPLDGP